MARIANINTPYKITLHVNGKYRYATTRPLFKREDGSHYNKSIHWGTVTEDLKFIPGKLYLCASLEERAKLIFPDNWDLSELEKLQSNRKPGRPSNDEPESQSRQYGDIWLLEKIAEKTGIRKDLETIFDGNQEKVNDVMTLAMFPYLTGFNYSRVARWQRVAKSPSEDPLTSCYITRLTQSITEHQRMQLFSLRASRVSKHAFCAIDSTTRSAYGDSLADIKWGKNKEGVALPQTLEVVVYTLDDHMPIYYLSLPGNIPDSRTVPVIFKELDDAGFGKDLLYITDRGYESIKNIEQYILADRSVLMCIKTGTSLVYEKIKEFGDFGARPEGMTLDVNSEVYYKQYDIPYEVKSIGNYTKKADRLKLNLYFDPVKRGTDQLELDLSVERQKLALTEMKAEQAELDKDMTAHDFPYFKVTLDDQKHIVSFEKDERKIAQAMKTSGFFANLTHKVDMSAPKALDRYKRRDEQEKYFQQMKTQMVCDRQRNWSEEGKSGRLLILFVSMILGSYLRHIWKSNEDLKKICPSSLDILDEMRSIRCLEHPHHAAMITPFVGDQLTIAKAFGFDIPKGCEPGYISRAVGRKRGRPKKNA